MIENAQIHYVTYLWILRNVTGQSCDVTLMHDRVSRPQRNVTGLSGDVTLPVANFTVDRRNVTGLLR
jgi:hypothetical protein